MLPTTDSRRAHGVLTCVAAAALLAPALAPARAPPAPADLVVLNARVHTVDDARPEAQPFAVRDGRFVFAGSARQPRPLSQGGRGGG